MARGIDAVILGAIPVLCNSASSSVGDTVESGALIARTGLAFSFSIEDIGGASLFFFFIDELLGGRLEGTAGTDKVEEGSGAKSGALGGGATSKSTIEVGRDDGRSADRSGTRKEC